MDVAVPLPILGPVAALIAALLIVAYRRFLPDQWGKVAFCVCAVVAVLLYFATMAVFNADWAIYDAQSDHSYAARDAGTARIRLLLYGMLTVVFLAITLLSSFLREKRVWLMVFVVPIGLAGAFLLLWFPIGFAMSCSFYQSCM